MSRTKIQSVAPGTPAHQAGVRPGETLLAINGHPIVDVLDLSLIHISEPTRRS